MTPPTIKDQHKFLNMGGAGSALVTFSEYAFDKLDSFS